MESLQIAQVLADLSDLQNTDPAAASSLLTAQQRPSIAPRTASTFSERLGRKFTPPMSRTNSTRSAPPSSPAATSTAPTTNTAGFVEKSAPNSGSGTPNANSHERGNPLDTDEDLKRARTLLELFEMRGKFKQMGDVGLIRSKERVDAVAARYAKRDLEERERASRSKYLYPNSRA